MTAVALGEIVDIRKGKKPTVVHVTQVVGSKPCILIDEVRGAKPAVFTTDEKGVEVLPDDLCIVWDGANAGTVGFGVSGFVGSTVARLRFKRACDWDVGFVGRLLMGLFPELNLAAKGKGATIPHVDKRQLEELQIPRYSVPEQKRIAAILDQADELRRKRQRAIGRLNQLGDAIFFEMFGDLVRNEKSWPTCGTLGDYSEIVSGITKGRDPRGRSTRAVPYLAVVNVQDKRLQLDSPKQIQATEDEIARYKLLRGDLLLTEGGDPDKLGRGTLWNDELPECIHQNHVFRVRLTSNEYNPTFLNWMIGSNFGKAYFLKSAKQTTGIASINSTQLKAFPMLKPPKDLQDTFSKKLKAVEEFSVQHLAGDKVFDRLYSAVQHKAFRGEL